MSTQAHALSDSAVMVRRQLLHMKRYPVLTFFVVGIPVILLMLFVYVFGGTLCNGLGGVTGGREAYVNYVVPGILLITISSSAQGSAISVAMDMAEGIIARFRTMRIFGPSVLTGHVIGSLIQNMYSLAAVIGVALLMGFRPTATAVEWVAAAGILLLFAFAITWFSVACGLVTKSVEAASNLPMPLILLPFLGSGFVPTDSMPTAVRVFAEYQPFTPVMETLRGLLLGTAIGNSAILAVAWSVVITMVCFFWSKALYNRQRAS